MCGRHKDRLYTYNGLCFSPKNSKYILEYFIGASTISQKKIYTKGTLSCARHVFRWSKIEFVDKGKVLTNIFKCYGVQALPCGIWGQHTRENDCSLIVQHASRNVSIFALTLFGCCMTRSINFMSWDVLKLKTNANLLKVLISMWQYWGGGVQ
jgi:hypothetical protein